MVRTACGKIMYIVDMSSQRLPTVHFTCCQFLRLMIVLPKAVPRNWINLLYKKLLVKGCYRLHLFLYSTFYFLVTYLLSLCVGRMDSLFLIRKPMKIELEPCPCPSKYTPTCKNEEPLLHEICPIKLVGFSVNKISRQRTLCPSIKHNSVMKTALMPMFPLWIAKLSLMCPRTMLLAVRIVEHLLLPSRLNININKQLL